MAVLITGGTGFLGKRTAAFFKGLGTQVYTPSHQQLDITCAWAVLDWFREHHPSAVIHTAAISDTGLCQRQPEWSEQVNVAGSVHLAKACREFGAKLIVCSSDQVYAGSPLPGPHAETEVLTPGNVYGRQKLLAEQLCMEIAPQSVCLRLSWMYSTENYPPEHSHFLTSLQKALRDDTKPLIWPLYDRRGITDTASVIANLPKALALPGGVYNFGASNDANTYETVRFCLEQLGMHEALLRLKPNETAFRDKPRDISMDLTRTAGVGITFPSTKEGLMHALKK